MKIFLWILFGLVMAAVLFLVVPSVLAFIFAFRGKKAADMPDRDLDHLIYKPYKDRILTDFRYMQSLQMEPVEIRSIDGKTLRGQYLDGGFDKTALLVHGYHTNALNNFAVMGRVLYEELGYNLLLINQRASGESDGKFVTFGLKERYDVRYWVRYLDRRPEVKCILVAGVSMGAASIAFTAEHLRSKKVKALIFDCGFTSPKSQILLRGKEMHYPAELMYPIARIIALLAFREDIEESTLPHLQRAKLPALFIHGTKDATVPFYEGENAYREYKGEKRKLFVEGAGHAVAFYHDYDNAKKVLKAFSEKYVYDNEGELL